MPPVRRLLAHFLLFGRPLKVVSVFTSVLLLLIDSKSAPGEESTPRVPSTPLTLLWRPAEDGGALLKFDEGMVQAPMASGSGISATLAPDGV